jgi:hypothetical protein
MNAKRHHPDKDIAKLLSELDLSETLLLLDCLREVQFWIKDAHGRYPRTRIHPADPLHCSRLDP